MLDDLAVLELENVDDSVAATAGRRHVMDVQNNVVTVGEGTRLISL